MQGRPPILNRWQMSSLLFCSKRHDRPEFQLPLDIVRKIGGYGWQSNWIDYQEALQHVANGALETVRTMLQIKPYLILFEGGIALTPAGLTLADPKQTLLECAIGAGDAEMVEIIMPYYSQFKDGEAKKDQQLARYRQVFADMQATQHDLSALMQELINSSPEDVSEELKTENYNEEYKKYDAKPLRDKLNKFRENILDPKFQKITQPRMHFEPQQLLNALKLLYDNWDNPELDDQKKRLFWRQIIGLLEIKMPAFLRCLFARNGIKTAIQGRSYNRSFDYKFIKNCSFPLFDIKLIRNRKGVGFESGIDLYGGGPHRAWYNIEDEHLDFETFITMQNKKLAKLIKPQPKNEPQPEPENESLWSSFKSFIS